MAFSWKEKYGTIINAQTWEESVEGYKITTVLGLAFNYYFAYTKFITGLDLTLDWAIKIETFYAKCYKLGQATEFKSNTYKTGVMETDHFFACLESKELVVEVKKKAIEAETKLVGKITEQIGIQVKEVTAQEIKGGISAEVWTTNKTIETPDFTLTCAVGAAINSGPCSVDVLPSAVLIVGPLVELG